jgi:hypothetical protein
MTRKIPIPAASFALVIAAAGFLAAGPAPAAESRTTAMQVISSDATARFVPLGVNKAVVIELPKDIKDVLVADPTIVNTVLRTSRRVYVIGTALGETNVYLFDTDGRQIGALDIVVAPIPQPDPPPLLENSALPGKSVMVYRGVDDLRFYRCTPTCSSPPPPKPENADKPTNAKSTTVVRDAQGIPTGTSTTSTNFATGK